jgi:hypothetical protein
MALVHIRFDGRAFDVEQTDLDIGDLSTDADIRQKVATHLGVPLVKLQAFAIDKAPNGGDITLRPEAVFG